MSSRRSAASDIPDPFHSFRGAALKIEWAHKLLDDLNAEIIRFIDRKPYTITLKPNGDGVSYLLQVNLTERLPWFITCMVGDICHNLRASMDFAWMGVIRSAKHGSVAKSTLPMGANRKGIKSTIAKAFEGHPVPAQLERLLCETIACHHDFNFGGNTWIADLNDLSNWQKHNMLIPTFSVTKLGDNTVIKSNDGTVLEMSRTRVSGNVAGIGGTYAEMTYDSPPTVEVSIHLRYLGSQEPLVPALFKFAQTAKEALQAFCDAFPSPCNPTFR